VQIVRNTTVQNRSKQERLSLEHTIPAQNVKSSEVADFLQGLLTRSETKEQILFSLGCALLKNKTNPAAQRFLSEYNYEVVAIENIPVREFDLLGSTYQFLNTKLENLEKGSFYTGSDIAKDFVRDLDFSSGQIIFDPACGSGAFLFNSEASAEQIVGVDFDPIAIMIAKFNYFIKFPDAEAPKLYCRDFFEWYQENRDEKYDYIIGNPPYGATVDITKIPSKYVTSGESFSYFIEFCNELLKEKGLFRFLLPESILNVKRHTDIRDFILDHTNLKRIKQYTKKFSGVMSDVYMLEMNCDNDDDVVFVNTEETEASVVCVVGTLLRQPS
jgi:type I restriction-modification system DNA methylase subunit